MVLCFGTLNVFYENKKTSIPKRVRSHVLPTTKDGIVQ